MIGKRRVSSWDEILNAPRVLDSRFSSCHISSAKSVFRVWRRCADVLADCGRVVGIFEHPVIASLTWIRTRSVLGVDVVGFGLSFKEPVSLLNRIAKP